jgi:hypothetical protein
MGRSVVLDISMVALGKYGHPLRDIDSVESTDQVGGKYLCSPELSAIDDVEYSHGPSRFVRCPSRAGSRTVGQMTDCFGIPPPGNIILPMDHRSRTSPLVSRRRFLQMAGITGLGAFASAILGIPPINAVPALAGGRRRVAYWSDPETWGGRVPGRNDVAIVSKRIILNVNARVRGVVIKPRGKLVFHPGRSVTLQSRGNVVVRGRLTVRPRRPAIVHRLLFPRIDERRFVGGGMEVVPSDVGLWVTDNGVLDIAGSPKLAWTKASGAVPVGATNVTLRDDPVGWRVGDEVVLTPTLSPSNPQHDIAYDTGTVVAVDRLTKRITLSSPTKFEHPAVEVEPGVVHTAEILNLTRNVRIEGTAAGRSHVWIRSSRRQYVRNATLRHTGPRRTRKDFPAFTEPVLGRYSLHFHMMDNASRGSIVEGVVVTESGNHAFVPHQSHGITFRDCITHNTFEDAYWWDPSPDPGKIPAHPTDDALYERCVASMVQSDPPSHGFLMAGFFLGARNRNVIRNCVAVGVQGSVDSCGFIWPENSSGGFWKFEDCLAHNNRVNGITAWHNNDLPHVISRYTAYHNGRAGILHGAYTNGFHYVDSVLYGNRFAAIDSHALSLSAPLLTFTGIRCDQAGLSPYCVVTTEHVAAPVAPARFVGCHFRGYGTAAFGFVDPGSPFPNLYTLTDCTFEGNEFWLASDIHVGSRIRVLDPVHGSITLRRADQLGVFHPEWNASVSNIS